MAARANVLTMDRDVAALVDANRDAGLEPHVLYCVCRCKILSEVMRCGWTPEMQAKIGALVDPRRASVPADPVCVWAAPEPRTSALLASLKRLKVVEDRPYCT